MLKHHFFNKLLGALAAWTAFTLPSGLLMIAVASGHGLFSSRIGSGVVHALELVAVAVSAAADVWGLRTTLRPHDTVFILQQAFWQRRAI